MVIMIPVAQMKSTVSKVGTQIVVFLR